MNMGEKMNNRQTVFCSMVIWWATFAHIGHEEKALCTQLHLVQNRDLNII